jgi:hypothetical protein
MIFFQPPVPEDGTTDFNDISALCTSACSELIPVYRSDPSVDLAGYPFCTMIFNTYEEGGTFSDHCYEEEGDRLRYACVISSFEGTLDVTQERCL